MAVDAPKRARFAGHALVYASMFDDSLAPTWTPGDLFDPKFGARLVAPHQSGYLIDLNTAALSQLASLVQDTDAAKQRVDISRVESVRFFDAMDALAGKTVPQVWASAPEVDGARPFLMWLTPFDFSAAADALLERLQGLRDASLQAPPLLASMAVSEDDANGTIARSIRAYAAAGDRLGAAMREYRQTKRAVTTVYLRTQDALSQLLASGVVYRIEPAPLIHSTSPGSGTEPDRPLPAALDSMPIVAAVDGGLTARSYFPAQAWVAPPLINGANADALHGNRVTSLIVQGHDWNNNLALPELPCRVGVVQAVARKDSRQFVDPQDFVAYLDLVMAAHPDTKVWNFSLNQQFDCDLQSVSYLGHQFALLARKHKILPTNSGGNKPGACIQPPADCEASITLSGRIHDDDGEYGDACPVCLPGPGPASMLKPDMSHFSRVRVIGGTVVSGSSFASALTAPLAAHTFMRLRDADPDLAKALILHAANGEAYDPALGFGSPSVDALPWECPPGYVTLQWRASLRPGAAFYWELPIPASLRKSGKLRGRGRLTAVLNPHPLVSDFAGPNYFSARLNTALQYPKRPDKFDNLLGSMDTDRVPEQEARAIDHKWCPVRQHGGLGEDFSKRGLAFNGDMLRVYARIYARDLYLYDYANMDEVPALNAVFVLTIGTGDPSDDIYTELRDALGAFVESAVLDADIDIHADN